MPSASIPADAYIYDKTPRYPLHGLNLDFAHYGHRQFGAQDVMVSKIMQGYLFPRTARTELLIGNNSSVSREEEQISVTDLDLLARMLYTKYDCDAPRHVINPDLWRRQLEDLCISDDDADRIPRVLPRRKSPDPEGERIIDVVQRFYLETTEPDMGRWLSQHKISYTVDEAKWQGMHLARAWPDSYVALLKTYQPHSRVQQQNFLFSGREPAPDFTDHRRAGRKTAARLPGTDKFLLLSWPWKLEAEYQECEGTFTNLSSSTDRCRPTRSSSEPPSGIWRSSKVPWMTADSEWSDVEYEIQCGIFYRGRSLTELDRRSRRRSLSRRSIADMFHPPTPRGPPPSTDVNTSLLKPAQVGTLARRFPPLLTRPRRPPGAWPHNLKPLAPRMPVPHVARIPCANCLSTSHDTGSCTDCGFCGSLDHLAPNCPVSKRNRCKCKPFPQSHTADHCHINCSRRCGNMWPVGHFRHRNAMSCKSRCCMCGLSGHTGKECHFRKCRCGEAHLGQDCRWKPECCVPGCGRYLCGLHCRECGSTEKPFLGWRCVPCLDTSRPAGRRARDFEPGSKDLTDGVLE